MNFMELAINIAKTVKGEIAVGAVIVKDGEVVAIEGNSKEKDNDVTCHAEILAIRKASEKLGRWRLDDCDLYVTLEPCMMCTGAIINSRIRKVYFAASDPKGGAFISNLKINEIKNINHYPEFESGIYQQEAAKLLQSFFQQKRKNKNKTIGKTVD